MNLLDTEWIPVRDAAGRRRWIAPHQLTEGIDSCPILAIDSPRADFNGALVQFLIGLIQTAWLRTGHDWDRGQLLWEPPSPDELRALFAPLREAFEFDGDGPRFMQDLTLGPADKPAENAIAALLIDAPGEQAQERNTDHFVKRGTVEALCPDCAAVALFTLMTNAPSGGAGHRTSLRGGGPLTTLIVYDPDSDAHPPRALWRDLVCNVIEPVRLSSHGGNEKRDLKYTFPWLAPQSDLQPGAETQPSDAHPAQMFWAMPRRVRLEFDSAGAGDCDLCDRRSEHRVARYLTKNYGLNYKGPWRHPLSPYYRTKPGEPALPMHPQPGGMGYRHWLGWVLGTERGGRIVEPAVVVADFLESSASPLYRLWAFGYDMDNMKARCWYESTFPLFELPTETRAAEAVAALVGTLLDAADAVAGYLRLAVRQAWFGEGEARGDLGFIDAGYWSITEAEFFVLVAEAVALVKAQPASAIEASVPLKTRWLDHLRRTAEQLFDQHAGSGRIEASHPARLAAARQMLDRQLRGEKLLKAAGLSTAADSPKRRPRDQAA